MTSYSTILNNLSTTNTNSWLEEHLTIGLFKRQGKNLIFHLLRLKEEKFNQNTQFLIKISEILNMNK